MIALTLVPPRLATLVYLHIHDSSADLFSSFIAGCWSNFEHIKLEKGFDRRFLIEFLLPSLSASAHPPFARTVPRALSCSPWHGQLLVQSLTEVVRIHIFLAQITAQ